MGNQSSVQEARANACEARAKRCEGANTGQFAIKNIDPPIGPMCKMGET